MTMKLGTQGDDIIVTDPSYWLALGQGGNDIIIGHAGLDGLYGGAGHDSIYGMGGEDDLGGGSGNDLLVGGSSRDTLDGGTGADTMQGGGNDDTYVVDNPLDVVTEAAGAGNDLVRTSISLVLPANVERMTYVGIVGPGHFAGAGNALNNVIEGGAGNDTLSGLGGNDTLHGNDGRDSLLGGDGRDGLTGDAGDDTLDGGAGDDVVSGGEGADSMIGGAGNDQMAGGGGKDTMAGGDGNDTYTVDHLFDVISEAFFGGYDKVRVEDAQAYVLSANVEDLEFDWTIQGASGTGNAESNRIAATDWADVLTGNGGQDTLIGHAGNDTLYGGAGNDSLNGGYGTDRLFGGDGNDTLDGATDVATQNAQPGILVGGDTLDGGAGNDLILAGGTPSWWSYAGGNHLIGGAGNDTLTGAAGDDTLTGGAGTDSMNGGLGADTFVFAAVSDSPDHAGGAETRDAVAGFVVGEDRLDLSAIDANAFSPLVNNGFAYSMDGPAAHAVWQQVWNGDDVIVKADVNGDAVADLAIRVHIAGGGALAVSDFVL
jgi:Ca2+-binding RTX toxin-like protein